MLVRYKDSLRVPANVPIVATLLLCLFPSIETLELVITIFNTHWNGSNTLSTLKNVIKK